MNNGTYRGGALAFKLDTLLKLSDVKGTDGKTTLLHFVVQEIVRTEGIRAARAARESLSFSSINSEDLYEDVSHDAEEHHRNLGFQVVSNVSNELEHVKKAASLESDQLTGTVTRLGHSMLKTLDFLNTDMSNQGEESGFYQTLKSFVDNAEGEVMALLEEEKRIMALVKSTGDYFHGKAGKDDGLRLFSIVRDFLVMLDKICKEMRPVKQPEKGHQRQVSNASASSDSRIPSPSPDPRQKLLTAVSQTRTEQSSSSSSSSDD